MTDSPEGLTGCIRQEFFGSDHYGVLVTDLADASRC
jgi:hypothetical protein